MMCLPVSGTIWREATDQWLLHRRSHSRLSPSANWRLAHGSKGTWDRDSAISACVHGQPAYRLLPVRYCRCVRLGEARHCAYCVVARCRLGCCGTLTSTFSVRPYNDPHAIAYGCIITLPATCCTEIQIQSQYADAHHYSRRHAASGADSDLADVPTRSRLRVGPLAPSWTPMANYPIPDCDPTNRLPQALLSIDTLHNRSLAFPWGPIGDKRATCMRGAP